MSLKDPTPIHDNDEISCTVTSKDPHAFCWIGDCERGAPDECPKVAIDRKRDKGTPWHKLEVRREPGGLRHYLDGEPIHCGTCVELQAITHLSDDYGEYTYARQTGVSVRYEASQDGWEIKAVLYSDIGGYECRVMLYDPMRFRWPERRP